MAKELKRYTDTFFCPYRKMLISLDRCIHDFVDADFARRGACFHCSDGERMRKEYQLDLPVFPPVVQKVKKSTSTQEEEAIAEAKRKAEERAKAIQKKEAETIQKAEEKAEAEAEARRKAERKAEAEAKKAMANKIKDDRLAEQVARAEANEKATKLGRNKKFPTRDKMKRFHSFLLFLVGEEEARRITYTRDSKVAKATGCSFRRMGGTSHESFLSEMKKYGFVAVGSFETKFQGENLANHDRRLYSNIDLFNHDCELLGWHDLKIQP